MIINVLAAKNSQGYINTQKGYGFFGHFFPTANFAIRKSVFKKVGGFDEKCKTGEDLDLCIKLVDHDYDLFYQEQALVHHHERSDVMGFYKQFFYYSHYHPYLFVKHMAKSRRLILYYAGLNPDPSRSISEIKIFNLWFPFSGMIYVSPFVVALSFSVVGVISLLLSFHSLSVISFILALLFFYPHFKNSINFKHIFKMIRFVAFKATLDVVYVVSGFLGGLKNKILFIGPPTFVGHKINYDILSEVTAAEN